MVQGYNDLVLAREYAIVCMGATMERKRRKTTKTAKAFKWDSDRIAAESHTLPKKRACPILSSKTSRFILELLGVFQDAQKHLNTFSNRGECCASDRLSLKFKHVSSTAHQGVVDEEN